MTSKQSQLVDTGRSKSRKAIRNVVCAITSHDYEGSTLASAVAFARTFSARLTIIHVMETWWSYLTSGMITESALMSKFATGGIDKAEIGASMRTMLLRLAQSPDRADIRVVRGECVNVIVRTMDEVHCDMLVIGAMKRHPWWWLVPHVSHVRRLIDKAECPVIVIRSR